MTFSFKITLANSHTHLHSNIQTSTHTHIHTVTFDLSRMWFMCCVHGRGFPPRHYSISASAACLSVHTASGRNCHFKWALLLLCFCSAIYVWLIEGTKYYLIYLFVCFTKISKYLIDFAWYTQKNSLRASKFRTLHFQSWTQLVGALFQMWFHICF